MFNNENLSIECKIFHRFDEELKVFKVYLHRLIGHNQVTRK